MKLANAGIEEQMGGKFGIGIGKLQGNQMYLKAKALAARLPTPGCPVKIVRYELR